MPFKFDRRLDRFSIPQGRSYKRGATVSHKPVVNFPVIQFVSIFNFSPTSTIGLIRDWSLITGRGGGGGYKTGVGGGGGRGASEVLPPQKGGGGGRKKF